MPHAIARTPGSDSVRCDSIHTVKKERERERRDEEGKGAGWVGGWETRRKGNEEEKKRSSYYYFGVITTFLSCLKPRSRSKVHYRMHGATAPIYILTITVCIIPENDVPYKHHLNNRTSCVVGMQGFE